MIPKEQRIEYFCNIPFSGNTLEKECQKWIEKGYVIHQIIPDEPAMPRPNYYLLLYKF